MKARGVEGVGTFEICTRESIPNIVVYVCERDGELRSMAVNAYGGGEGGGSEGGANGGPPQGQLRQPENSTSSGAQ